MQQRDLAHALHQRRNRVVEPAFGPVNPPRIEAQAVDQQAPRPALGPAGRPGDGGRAIVRHVHASARLRHPGPRVEEPELTVGTDAPKEPHAAAVPDAALDDGAGDAFAVQRAGVLVKRREARIRQHRVGRHGADQGELSRAREIAERDAPGKAPAVREPRAKRGHGPSSHRPSQRPPPRVVIVFAPRVSRQGGRTVPGQTRVVDRHLAERRRARFGRSGSDASHDQPPSAG